MTTILSLTWELLINVFETVIFYFYINSILTAKNFAHEKSIQISLLFVRFLMVTTTNALSLPPIYTVVLVILFNISFTSFLFKEKTITCFFWGSLHVLLNILGEMISYLLLSLLTPMLPNEIMYGEVYRFPCTTIYIICLAALSFVVSTFNQRKILFSFSQKCFVFFTMFIGIAISHCFMYIMVDLGPQETTLLSIVILANFIFVCFFIFLLTYIYQLAIKQQENEELQEKARLLELEEVQYRNLLSITETLREIKHDIHHHLATIHSFAQQNESERLMKYLDEYQTHFSLDYTTVSSGNLVIDSILSTKQFLARQHNVRLEHTIVLPNNLPFTDVALSALLGNLFDNAFEACNRIPETERWVRFQIKPYENMLLIHIENSFDGIINKPTNHGFISRKEEPNHGIGLKRVKTLVEEVHGFTDIRQEGQTFIVHIIVPLETTHEH